MPAMNVQRRLGKFTIVVKLFEMKQIKNTHLKLFSFYYYQQLPQFFIPLQLSTLITLLSQLFLSLAG